MAQHNNTGAEGEQLAVKHLITKGYQIIATNARFDKAEVDIIAQIGNDTVFVEVKTRQNTFFGNPEDAVSKRKMQLLFEAAAAYQEQNNTDGEIRFDIIAITNEVSGAEILHIEDAFYPGIHDE